jgi:hypothetical protein
MSAPGNEAPVWAPASGQLGRSDTAYVGITGVRIYTTGISWMSASVFGTSPAALVTGCTNSSAVIASADRTFPSESSGSTRRREQRLDPRRGAPVSSPRPRRNVSWAEYYRTGIDALMWWIAQPERGMQP